MRQAGDAGALALLPAMQLGGSEDEAIAGLLHDARRGSAERRLASCAPAPTPKCNPSRRGGSASRPIWSISGTPTCQCLE
jgi:hypothetical protein